MPPPGYEPFLRAICADPEDDTARLVYADWLEENGQPERAEFIRVQVERARLRAAGADTEALERRLRELRHAHEYEWRCELPRLSGVSWQRFWRGFVSGAGVVHWRFYERYADAIFAATPIQFLTISSSFDDASRQFAESKYLDQLDGLTISDGGNGYHATRVCLSLPAGKLKRLEIRLSLIEPYGSGLALDLVTADCFRETTHLYFRGAVTRDSAEVLRAALGSRVGWESVWEGQVTE
jgi:uncharacterized protein (TIGR02996 family)